MKTTKRPLVSLLLGALIVLLCFPAAARALSVSPNVVTVRAVGPTTVFLTYRNLFQFDVFKFVPVEAFWCGEISPNDNSCVPSTIFGRLPLRNELATQSGGTDNLTEVVTFPSSVTRQAFQRARAGGPSRFFFVRHFRDVLGTPNDVYVPVLVRLGSGGAGAPLSLSEVRLRWKKDRPVITLPRGASPPPFEAEIRYNGSGRLKGRWELVVPGDSQPRVRDLLPEADLPVEERMKQRRYRRIGRFDKILPPTGRLRLPGPDPDKIPINSDGLHLILLRIEATQDKVGSSNITESNVPGATVMTGGVAGFPLPVLRFIVGSGGDPALMAELTAGELVALEPRDRAKLGPGDPLTFSWDEKEGALIYKLVVQRDEKDDVLMAMMNPGVASYTAPPSLREHAGEKLRWRVEALGDGGIPIATSEWRNLRIEQ